MFTGDEFTVLIEALREYRIRLPEGARRILCDALIYRLGRELITQTRSEVLGEETPTHGIS